MISWTFSLQHSFRVRIYSKSTLMPLQSCIIVPVSNDRCERIEKLFLSNWPLNRFASSFSSSSRLSQGYKTIYNREIYSIIYRAIYWNIDGNIFRKYWSNNILKYGLQLIWYYQYIDRAKYCQFIDQAIYWNIGGNIFPINCLSIININFSKIAISIFKDRLICFPGLSASPVVVGTGSVVVVDAGVVVGIIAAHSGRSKHAHSTGFEEFHLRCMQIALSQEGNRHPFPIFLTI